MKSRKSIATLILLAIAFAWTPRDVSADTDKGTSANPSNWPDRTQYYALMAEGKKMGYLLESFKKKDGKAITTVDMKMTLNRMGSSVTMLVQEKHVETLDGKPLSAERKLNAGFMTQSVSGRIGADGRFHIRITGPGVQKKHVIPWPKDMLLYHGANILTRKKGFEEGTTYQHKRFDFDALGPKACHVTVGKQQKVDLFGRIVILTEVTMNTSGIAMTSYFNEDAHMLKQITNMMGMRFEAIACSKAIALSKDDPVDLIRKTLVKSPHPLTKSMRQKSLTYSLSNSSSNGSQLQLPSDKAQKFQKTGNGKYSLTVLPQTYPANVKLGYTGDEKAILVALKPNRNVQSDHETIRELAQKAIGNTTDAAEAARRIEAFVHKYIDKKDLSVGYASALETAQSRQGDCTEHAVLTAALCRAVGIPAQVVSGIAYVPELQGQKAVFGPHAWNRVYLGDRWVALDSALNGYDTGHIAMNYGSGDYDDIFELVNKLGAFTITSVE